MNETKAQPMFERHRDLEDRTDGPDVLSAIEASEKGAAPLVGTGELVLLPASSAEALCRNWDAETGRWDAAADKHQANKDWREALLAHAKAETFETCARRLRRLIASANERQRQENSVSAKTGT